MRSRQRHLRFPVAVGEYLRRHHPEIFRDPKLRHHFHHGLFHAFDFDNTMLRIGSMNMLLHGVENPDIRYRDSLAQDHAGEEEKYTLITANSPFAGSLDYENCAKDLLQVVKTKKTELLVLALYLRLLKPGGRAAVIVPDGVLFGSSNAHKTLRRILVEEQRLDAVISLPGGVFKPYAGVSTAILLFTKTNSGGTDHVWFYDVDADGMSLDDKRTELLPPEKLDPVPRTALTADDHAKNNLPDILARWRSLQSGLGVPPMKPAEHGQDAQATSSTAPFAGNFEPTTMRTAVPEKIQKIIADIDAQGKASLTRLTVLINRLGNSAVNGHRPVKQFDALTAVRELFHVACWLAHNAAAGCEAITLAGCWAHARRGFIEARGNASRTVGWLLRHIIAHLYEIERRLRESGAGPRLRDAVRASQSTAIVNRIRAALLRIRPRHLPQSAMGRAITYTLDQWPALIRFLAVVRTACAVEVA